MEKYIFRPRQNENSNFALTQEQDTKSQAEKESKLVTDGNRQQTYRKQEGDLGMFKDPRDGQTYKTIHLNGLTWMAENLNYEVGEGCWIYEKRTGFLGLVVDREKVEGYGRLYTLEAAMKACPPGWRLPTYEEWRDMAKKFGGCFEDSEDGGKSVYKALIEGGSIGFSARLGGRRHY